MYPIILLKSGSNLHQFVHPSFHSALFKDTLAASRHRYIKRNLFSLSIYPTILSHFFAKSSPSCILVLIRCHKSLFCAHLSHGFPHLAQSGDIRCTFPIIVSAVCIHNSRCPLFQQRCNLFYRTVYLISDSICTIAFHCPSYRYNICNAIPCFIKVPVQPNACDLFNPLSNTSANCPSKNLSSKTVLLSGLFSSLSQDESPLTCIPK